MKINKPLSGSCLCGEIKYEVTNIESRIGHCHCTMCQKFHGAAFSTYAEAKTQNFKWIEGQNYLKSYFATNGTERKFCSNCGSSLIFVPSNDKVELIEFSLATLDSEIVNKPDAHVFIESEVNWYKITDDLPQFTNGRD